EADEDHGGQNGRPLEVNAIALSEVVRVSVGGDDLELGTDADVGAHAQAEAEFPAQVDVPAQAHGNCGPERDAHVHDVGGRRQVGDRGRLGHRDDVARTTLDLAGGVGVEAGDVELRVDRGVADVGRAGDLVGVDLARDRAGVRGVADAGDL